MTNSEGNIEELIKRYLENKMSNKEYSSPYSDCPQELNLSDYLENRLNQEEENSLLEHIADCPHCLSLLELAQQAKEKAHNTLTPEMITHAKDVALKRPKKSISNYRWAILALLSFALSFIFTRYFLQFLILAVVLSLKWILDTGSTRTLIMIYETWRKKDKDTAHKIAEELQNRIKQRR